MHITTNYPKLKSASYESKKNHALPPFRPTNKHINKILVLEELKGPVKLLGAFKKGVCQCLVSEESPEFRDQKSLKTLIYNVLRFVK